MGWGYLRRAGTGSPSRRRAFSRLSTCCVRSRTSPDSCSIWSDCSSTCLDKAELLAFSSVFMASYWPANLAKPSLIASWTAAEAVISWGFTCRDATAQATRPVTPAATMADPPPTTATRTVVSMGSELCPPSRVRATPNAKRAASRGKPPALGLSRVRRLPYFRFARPRKRISKRRLSPSRSAHQMAGPNLSVMVKPMPIRSANCSGVTR